MNAFSTRALHRVTRSACACVVATVALFIHAGQAHALVTDDVVVNRNDTTTTLEIFVNDPTGSDVTIVSGWGIMFINDPHGIIAGNGCTNTDAQNVECDTIPVTSLAFFGHAGNDHLNVASNLPFPLTAYGSSGNDRLMGGALNDHLYGHDGNDTLLGRGGTDDMRGGRGSDRLVGGSGDDLMRGGRGNDVLHAGSGHDLLLGSYGDDSLYCDGDSGYSDILAGGPGTNGGRFDYGADAVSDVDFWL